jgi:hypothetical protein
LTYSQQLKDRIKEVYPLFDAFHKMAEEGSENLITALEELCSYEVSIYEVLEGLQTTEKMHNLFAKCQRMALKHEIYSQAMQEFSNFQEKASKIIVP